MDQGFTSTIYARVVLPGVPEDARVRRDRTSSRAVKPVAHRRNGSYACFLKNKRFAKGTGRGIRLGTENGEHSAKKASAARGPSIKPELTLRVAQKPSAAARRDAASAAAPAPPPHGARAFLRAPREIATKPVLIGVTERRAPQLLHCMKYSRFCFCIVVCGDLHDEHVTYSPT